MHGCHNTPNTEARRVVIRRGMPLHLAFGREWEYVTPVTVVKFPGQKGGSRFTVALDEDCELGSRGELVYVERDDLFPTFMVEFEPLREVA